MTDSVAEGAPAGPAEIVAGRAPQPGQARFGPVFAVVTAGIAVVNLDLFIVNVALPSIGRDFHGTDLASLSWVLNAYAIVFAALLVPAGRAADLIGRRAAFLTGMVVFAVASAACAAAPDVWVLVGARIVQAAGGALLMPASLSLLLAAAPPERRTGAIRAWTSVGGAAAALGPVVGGALVEASWHWVFLVNVPIIAIALIAGLRVLPLDRTTAHAAEVRAQARPDILGAAVFTVAIGTLALALVKADDWGWTSAPVLGGFAAAAIAPNGTRSGPGATPSPVRSADHPHTSWHQRVTSSSIAPKAMPKTTLAAVAVANSGRRSRCSSITGAGWRADR